MLCLKEGENYQTPKSQAETHDLSLLELMGDSHLLLPQEIAQIFFGNFQCPILPSGILAVAAQQPGWRNAEDSSQMFTAWLTPGVGTGLGVGYPHLGQWCPALPVGAWLFCCAASIHLQMPVVSGGGGGLS